MIYYTRDIYRFCVKTTVLTMQLYSTTVQHVSQRLICNCIFKALAYIFQGVPKRLHIFPPYYCIPAQIQFAWALLQGVPEKFCLFLYFLNAPPHLCEQIVDD